jgi:iron complex outermembrane receptor protein
VTGPGRAAGLAGERPAGTPSLYARADVQYRTDLPGSFTPTLTVLHTGTRAMGSAPLAVLGGKQAMLPPVTTFDIGMRNRFKLGDMPVSMRAVLMNVFDAKAWKVVASNTLQPDERRRFMLTLTTDF